MCGTRQAFDFAAYCAQASFIYCTNGAFFLTICSGSTFVVNLMMRKVRFGQLFPFVLILRECSFPPTLMPFHCPLAIEYRTEVRINSMWVAGKDNMLC